MITIHFFYKSMRYAIASDIFDNYSTRTHKLSDSLSHRTKKHAPLALIWRGTFNISLSELDEYLLQMYLQYRHLHTVTMET